MVSRPRGHGAGTKSNYGGTRRFNDEDIQRWIDDSIITLNGCRNGRECVWIITDNYECAVYVDSLKEMANAEIEKQLL